MPHDKRDYTLNVQQLNPPITRFVGVGTEIYIITLLDDDEVVEVLYTSYKCNAERACMAWLNGLPAYKIALYL